MNETAEKRVFLDMSVDEKPIGRIEIKLFLKEAPKTCENFRALCTGEVGMAPNNRARLHYKGNEIHRVVPKFMIQGGDITDGDGRGGYSIYGRYFDDERFVLRHTKPYLLSMANKGPNSNSSQFFITTAPAPHCNGKHVVFGEVMKGQEVVDIVENLEVDLKSKPIAKVCIYNCGELVKKKKPSKTEEEIAALEEKKRKETKRAIPEVPKSWLYRDTVPKSTETIKERRTKTSRSRSRSRKRYENRDERENRGDRRHRSGDRRHEYRRYEERRRENRKDDMGIVIRGRGRVQFNRGRSQTPEHWRRNPNTVFCVAETISNIQISEINPKK